MEPYVYLLTMQDKSIQSLANTYFYLKQTKKIVAVYELGTDHSPSLRQLTYLAINHISLITKAHFDANDQDKNIRSRVKGKRQIESSKGKRGDKDKDYVDASSNGFKYSMQAKVPVIHGGIKEQLISNKRCQPCYHPSDSREICNSSRDAKRTKSSTVYTLIWLKPPAFISNHINNNLDKSGIRQCTSSLSYKDTLIISTHSPAVILPFTKMNTKLHILY
ncbi:hypothetical protein NC653_017496 [Populus alba x Populus x berolinensis]|uniref:Uncharacterized protein n=1 Tax=Populus alba x Populus x berolinensis TaxID=444605 RepID=A0AAD6QQP3_9ROSI|nr:hypothetical protein NC653_017496 [Populus alba x Populus x berolinensis]